LPPRDAIEVDRPGKVKIANLSYANRPGRHSAAWNHGNPDIRLQKLHQIAFGANIVDVNWRLQRAKTLVQPLGKFAVATTEELRIREVPELDTVSPGKLMFEIECDIKRFLEQRPAIEPIPIVVEIGGDRQFDFSLLQRLGNFLAASAKKHEFNTCE
jgi:hypothetical protein